MTLKEEMYFNFGYYFCQHCKKTVSFVDVHHIIWRSEKPGHPDINCKKNLILLCRNCHNEFHDKKGTRNQLVLDRQLHLIFGNDVLNK